MIYEAVNFLVDELDAYMALQFGTSNRYVTMVHMAEQDGGGSLVDAGKMGCALVNVEEERVGKTHIPYGAPSAGQYALINPEIRLNLYLLFASNPGNNNYESALKLVANTVSFFQGKNEFNTTNSPSLDPAIDTLQLDLYSIPLEEQSYLWGAIGAKYMPSVVYKVRLIAIQDNRVLQTDAAINQVNPSVTVNN